MQKLFSVLMSLFVFMLAAMPAMAESIIDVTGLTPDVAMVGTLGAAICGALLSIWGVRKVIKLLNRS